MKFNGQIEEKWGLCFAGGGGKGAYEIGVWRALEECTNIKFSAVAGTSVGALNAILFATKTVDEAEEIWRGITPDKLLKPKKEFVLKFLEDIFVRSMVYKYVRTPFPVVNAVGSVTGILRNILVRIEKYPFKTAMMKYVLEEGIFSREGLEEIIKTSGVAKSIKDSEIDCLAAICKPEAKKDSIEYILLNDMNEKDVIDTLLASSAIPLIYGKHEVKGKKYRDGGLEDNIPHKALYRCGCSHVVVVNLENPYMKKRMVSPKVTGITPFLLNGFNDISYRSVYEDMKVFDIYPKRDLKGVWGTLNFNPKNIEKLIEYGYEDTRECLEELKKREM